MGIIGGGIITPQAPQMFTPGNPTATSSTTRVMMGLGSTIAFTPKFRGNVMVLLIGTGSTATGAAAFNFKAWYGTGTAPNNGDAETGTFALGTNPQLQASSVTANQGVGWSLIGTITGLTPGTAYWLDLSLKTTNGADAAALYSITAIVWEAF